MSITFYTALEITENHPPMSLMTFTSSISNCNAVSIVQTEPARGIRNTHMSVTTRETEALNNESSCGKNRINHTIYKRKENSGIA